MRPLNGIIQIGNLILKYKNIVFIELFQHLIDVLPAHLHVGSAICHDGVLAHLVNLNNGMSGTRTFQPANQRDIHACFFQFFEQECSVLSDASRMVNLQTGACHCNRLIQSLASGKYFPVRRRLRLLHLQNMFQKVSIINVKRS